MSAEISHLGKVFTFLGINKKEHTDNEIQSNG